MPAGDLGDVVDLDGALFPEAPRVLTNGRPRAGTRKRSWVMDRRWLRRAVMAGRHTFGPDDAQALRARPRTRADCIDGPRPCPWVGCRYHLGLEVAVAGGIQFTWPGAELEELPETCALDVADAGPVTLERAAGAMNMTRGRVQQIELQALQRLQRRMPALVGLTPIIEGARSAPARSSRASRHRMAWTGRRRPVGALADPEQCP